MRLNLEQLDSRLLPAASISGGVLTITGEVWAGRGPLAGDSTRIAAITDSSVLLYQNGKAITLPGHVHTVRYIGTGRNDIFAGVRSEQVQLVEAHGGDGDDLLLSGIVGRAELHGGDGRDRLYGQALDNELWGDGGSDSLVIAYGVGVIHSDALDYYVKP